MAGKDEKPSKPGPVKLDQIKVPPAQGSPVSAGPQMQVPTNQQHRIEMHLVHGEVVGFNVAGGEEAAKFIDSISVIFEKKMSISRFRIANELYCIPTERFIYAKLIEPGPGVPGIPR